MYEKPNIYNNRTEISVEESRKIDLVCWATQAENVSVQI